MGPIITISLIQERREEVLKRYSVDNVDNVYSIYCNGTHVGIVEFRKHTYSNSVIYIDEIYVEKEYRNRGIGREIIKTIQKYHKATILGNSTLDSVGFWTKIGAYFEYDEEELMQYREASGMGGTFILI